MTKTFSTAALVAAIVGTAGLATAAMASGDDYRAGASGPPASEWMSVSALAAQLEGQGYQILEIDRERGAWDVEMIDANGMRVEAYLDPITGEPLRGMEYDD